MYLAYKYARKKYKEREQAKATGATKSTSPDSQPAVQQDAVETGEEKTKIRTSENHETLQDDPIEKKRRRKYRLKIIFGLVAPFTLQGLDTTIIASALPFIAKDFSMHI